MVVKAASVNGQSGRSAWRCYVDRGVNDNLLFGGTWSCGLRTAPIKEEGGASATWWPVPWGRSIDGFSSVWWREEQSGSKEQRRAAKQGQGERREEDSFDSSMDCSSG
jgi:hypothetical protein